MAGTRSPRRHSPEQRLKRLRQCQSLGGGHAARQGYGGIWRLWARESMFFFGCPMMSQENSKNIGMKNDEESYTVL